MHEISSRHLNKITEIFCKMNSHEDMQDLLLDVCTKKELESIFQRFRIAEMLKNGLTFVEIEAITGISSTTITKVSKSLKNGKGYNKAFRKYNLSIDLQD